MVVGPFFLFFLSFAIQNLKNSIYPHQTQRCRKIKHAKEHKGDNNYCITEITASSEPQKVTPLTFLPASDVSAALPRVGLGASGDHLCPCGGDLPRHRAAGTLNVGSIIKSGSRPGTLFTVYSDVPGRVNRQTASRLPHL